MLTGSYRGKRVCSLLGLLVMHQELSCLIVRHDQQSHDELLLMDGLRRNVLQNHRLLKRPMYNHQIEACEDLRCISL